MKSDKTEMVLLGAAAAVIALVVAFSMMGDKGNKRSLDSLDDEPVETARNVRQKVEKVEAEVEAKVAELENAGKKIAAESSKAENIVKELRPLVPAGGRADMALTKAESLLGKAKDGGNALRSVIGDERVDQLKEAAADKVKAAGKSAFNYLREAAGKKFEQNKPKTGFFASLFSPVKETPLPPMGGSREVRL